MTLYTMVVLFGVFLRLGWETGGLVFNNIRRTFERIVS